MSQVAVIVNDASGSGTCRVRLSGIPKDTLPEKDIFDLEADLDALVIEIAGKGYTTIAAAGGDGTVASLAAALVRTGIPVRLAVIPLGTFNHFAKDLSIPLDPREAFSVARTGPSAFIDIAKVNDTYFINNSSIGAYPFAIRERDALVQSGVRKVFATLFTFIPTLLRPRIFSLEIGAEPMVKEAYCVFIGNNRYKLAGAAFSRENMREGVLFVAFIRARSRIGLARLLLRSLFGRVIADRDFDVIGLSSLVVSSKGPLLVSHDGEVHKMRPPLRYEILPRALSVAIPV